MQELDQLGEAWTALSDQHIRVSYSTCNKQVNLHYWARQDGDDYGYRTCRGFDSIADAWTWVRSWGN